MINLLAIFRAGFVRRWHTNPDLAHTVDRIDGHSARVARIILALHPKPTLDLIQATLIHDDGESVVGDVSATFKASMSGMLRTELAAQENACIADLWPVSPKMKKSIGDHDWLRFADRLDAYMWAAHHAPHIMARDGWPESRTWLYAEAERLNIDMDAIGSVRFVIEQMEDIHATS